jgi:hypothetical protein
MHSGHALRELRRLKVIVTIVKASRRYRREIVDSGFPFMSKIRFAAAVAAGFFLVSFSAVPAGANPIAQGPSGYIEAFGQAAWHKTNVTDGGPWSGVGVAGRANIWLRDGWSTQLDASGNFVDATGQSILSGSAAVHLSRRDPGRGLIGAFAGYATTNDCCASGQDGSLFGGLEAQYYLHNLTLYGLVGFATQVSGYYGGNAYPEDRFSQAFVQGTARYFLQPNTKLEASIGFMTGTIWGPEYSPDYKARALTFSAEAEHQLADKPVSLFARLTGYSDRKYTTSPSLTYAAQVGLRVRFGQTGTLLDQDRNGATLKAPEFDHVGWLRWDD